MSHAKLNDPFPTTQFTLIEGLRSDDEAVRRSASERLARLYLPPILRFIQRRPDPPGDPDDLTQEFFTTIILSRKLFEGVDPARGKLRALLSISLKRFLINKHRLNNNLPNIGWADSLPDPNSENDADGDAMLDAEWYVNIFRQAIRTTRAYYVQNGLVRYWDAFEKGRLRPSLSTAKRPSNGNLSRELGFEQANFVAVAVHRVKARLKSEIEILVAETAGTSEEQGEELRALASVLASHEAWNQSGNSELWHSPIFAQWPEDPPEKPVD